jgi:hypothetical protein
MRTWTGIRKNSTSESTELNCLRIAEGEKKPESKSQKEK